jgi:hypothetical protein
MKNDLMCKEFLSRSFYLYKFCKYVSYGFPIIKFYNPGVHYETPCIISIKKLCTFLGDDLQEIVETRRSCSVLIVKILYCVIVPNLLSF